MSDIDTAVVDSLKVLDLKWPIREADIARSLNDLCLGPSPAAFQCARVSWYEPFPERLGVKFKRLSPWEVQISRCKLFQAGGTKRQIPTDRPLDAGTKC